MLLTFLGLIFFALCIFAAINDISRLTIPNWLNLSIAALFVPAAITAGLPIEMIGGHVLVGLVAFAIGFGLFAVGVFGGGDAKMIPAVLLWTGPSGAIWFVFYMAIAGGVCALVLLLARRTVPAALVPGFMRAPFEEKGGVPYGVAIAAGALLSSPHSPLLAGITGPGGWLGLTIL